MWPIFEVIFHVMYDVLLGVVRSDESSLLAKIFACAILALFWIFVVWGVFELVVFINEFLG